MRHQLQIPPRAQFGNAQAALEAINLEINISIPSVSDVIGMFRNTFPTIKNKLVQVIDSFAPEENSVHEIKELNRLAEGSKKTILDIGIVTYGKTLLPVPEGLAKDISFIQYLSFLESISKDFDEGVRDILTEYKIVVSTFISNKEARSSIKDHSLFYKRIEKQRKALTDEMTSYFDNALTRSRVPFEEIYSQTKDVYVAVDLSNKLHKNRQRSDVPGIKKHAQQCVEVLDMIIEQSEKNSLGSVSGAAAADLANGAMEMGRWLELVSIYNFRLDQAITSVKQQVEILSKFR